uniref:Uncharacterized protein n=2 Tax=Sphaeramia orbicularis TaxID=375764 RepID=A0A673B8K4_9TELE
MQYVSRCSHPIFVRLVVVMSQNDNSLTSNNPRRNRGRRGSKTGSRRRGSNRSKAMANDKNPLNQLKDLVDLKDQLEDIQRRMEDEIQAGVPPGGSLLASPFLKGFLAGYIVARLRSSALMGVAVGTCTGIYAAQNYRVPNIETTIKDYMSSLRGGRK